MRRFIVLFIWLLLTHRCISQEQHHFSAWGMYGLGVSSFAFTTSDWGFSGNYGCAIRYDYFTLKYKRCATDQFSVLDFREHLGMHELLFGYAFDLDPKIEGNDRDYDFLLGTYVGFAQIEYIQRGRPIPSPPQNTHAGGFITLTDYESITNKASALSLEIELEFHFLRYFGISLVTFSTVSRFYPVIGSNLCLHIGYL